MPSETVRFKVQAFDPKPLVWWYARRKQLDLSPSYQRRGGLWSGTDKAYLIDSILNGFDIPKLYVADFTWGGSPLNKSKLPYAIIDGKQRFEAIFGFFESEFPLNPDFIYRTQPERNLAGLRYDQLRIQHPDIAELLDTFPLTVMSVYSDSQELINELFVRLNRNKPLSGAELRNAMTGPASLLIQAIAAHTFFSSTISFSIKRLENQNIAAKLLLFEVSGKPVSTKKNDLDLFVGRPQTKKNRDELELAARRVIDVLDDMSGEFLARDSLLRSSGDIPVIYWVLRDLSAAERAQFRSFYVVFKHALVNVKTAPSALSSFTRNSSMTTVIEERVAYIMASRSVNDEQSHLTRTSIMSKWLRAFLLSPTPAWEFRDTAGSVES
jgi:hypothetical protein